MEMVELFDVSDREDESELRRMIERHLEFTGSTVAAGILENWEAARHQFVKVMPTEYRLALLRIAEEREIEEENLEEVPTEITSGQVAA
jgi:glutamate synthase domain-containing protein 3